MPSRENTNISASWWSEDGDTSVRVFINNVMDNKNVYAMETYDITRDFQQTGAPLDRKWYGIDIRRNF